MARSEYLTPTAILVGAVIIAVGAYLGLRGRAPEPAPAQPAVTATATPSLAPTAAPGPVPPSTRYTEAVKKALEAVKRDTFVPKCWKPAISRDPKPAQSSYTIEMTFNAEGIEIARAISELRAKESRPDVAECLRQQSIGMRIEPPGSSIALTLPLVFP